MRDLIIVFIGFGIISYFFFTLGSARIAIQKGRSGIIWFLISLIIPPIAFTIINFLEARSLQNSNKKSFFDNIIMELTQPFIDLAHTSQALFGLNLSYLFEGLTYFGVLGLLGIFFNNFIKLDDVVAGNMLGVLTAGITISMLFLGATVDWIGLRKSLLLALVLMLAGRILIAISPNLGIPGLWNSSHIIAVLGLFGIILGYGIYQPACYAGVKQLTDEKTSAMGYAMLYALMNLGGFLPAIISPPLRKSFEIPGVFWAYVVFTVLGIGVVYFIITKKAMTKAIEAINNKKVFKEVDKEEEKGLKLFLNAFKIQVSQKKKTAIMLSIIFSVILLIALSKEFFFMYYNINVSNENSLLVAVLNINWIIGALLIGLSFAIFIITDARFAYFVFILIFVQTLFAHNWLTLPQYTSRAFVGQTYFGIENFVNDNFEFFVNLNPMFIFILTPMVTALTSKKNTYTMMIIGTLVMASPTFLLALGTNLYTLLAYLIIMSIGEAMWQPRFLQWVAEIAPNGMTGIYMGIGQFPWFLTKVITSLYSGSFLMKYCPIDTPVSFMNTEMMWLIYGFIAMITPLGLFLARGWMQKGFKTKHEG